MEAGDHRRLGGVLIGAAALWVSVGATALAADPEQVSAPAFRPGETWVVDEAIERGTNGFSDTRLNLRVESVGADSMVVGIKRDGAPGDYQDHVDGLDWSLRHLVEGREEPTVRPLSFPLTDGKTWVADYTDTERNGLQSSTHYHWTYKVVGWEDVTVPAGTFHAVRIEGGGVVEAHFEASSGAAGGAVTSAGDATAVVSRHDTPAHTEYLRVALTLDYSPRAHIAVKTVEDAYNSTETRIRRTTRTLVSDTTTP